MIRLRRVGLKERTDVVKFVRCVLDDASVSSRCQLMLVKFRLVHGWG